ncbi:MAG TPA: hypothetical protein PLD15_09710, partial [Mesotoga sp.]|nr:hypothetical protein [Mesotoga sp.]
FRRILRPLRPNYAHEEDPRKSPGLGRHRKKRPRRAVTVVQDPTYLRYTSLRFGGLERKVTTTFSTLPAGFSISLAAGTTDSSAKGNVGTGATLEFVGTTLTGDLVTSIGAGLARTGIESNAGHPLTYTAMIDETALANLGDGLADGGFLNAVDTVITVTFTLTDI